MTASKGRGLQAETVQTYQKEINRQQVRIAELEAQIQHLHKLLQRQESLKEQAKNLYGILDQQIIKGLDKRGYNRKKRSRDVTLPSVDLSSASREELLQAAQIYDVRRYFQYRKLSENMKLNYRIASKLYRSGRDISKHGAKSAYRLTKRGRN